MFDPSRDQVRAFFFETWRRYRAQQPLEGLQGMALQVILLHPEYHAVLEAPDRHRDRDYLPEMAQTNPFLHLSLHLALEEQLSIDQPPGIARRFGLLLAKSGERHDALHEALECLAEMVWRAQREGAPPDASAYLDCLETRARK
jgi:hypothetical protein